MSKKILDLIPESLRPDIVKEILSELSPAELRKALEERENSKTDKEIEEEIGAWATKENGKKD